MCRDLSSRCLLHRFDCHFLTHLNNYGKAEVEIEISSEGGGSGCEAVVAHGGHHPVEEHYHRPDEDGQGVEEVKGRGASFTFLTRSQE